MSMTVRQQLKYWGIAAAVFLVLLWALGNVILPFLVGGAIAYFLDPLADRLQRMGLSRTAATAVISVVALVGFVVLALLIVPLLFRQLGDLVNAAPTILNRLQTFLTTRFPSMLDDQSVVRETLAGIGKTIQSKGGELASGLLSSALSVINAVVFIVVVPVVAFYLLLDWDNMVGRLDQLLPREHRDTIRQLGRDIDRVLAGFVRGQVSVCLILGTFYAVALMLVGLKFGLLIGLFAGLISFIPFVGSIVGFVLSVGVALVQFWPDWIWIAATAAVFGLGQFLENYVLQPRLIGQNVGLHPVWVMFALFAGGALFGFVGVLLALPVTAVLAVLLRHAMARWRESDLYGQP